VLSELQYRCVGRYREAVVVLLLTVLAFSVRLYRVDFNSLSEDEVAKWAAVQEYRHGHFVGVNSEHPMLPKMLAWASLTAGERWGRVAATHGWPSLNPEGWLRLPNVLLLLDQGHEAGRLVGALPHLGLLPVPGFHTGGLRPQPPRATHGPYQTALLPQGLGPVLHARRRRRLRRVRALHQGLSGHNRHARGSGGNP
jgi:hypothetical protein